MNNGHTRESKHRIAVLEDEDPETFVAFCEYAYTGDYSVPRLPALREDVRKGVVESASSPGKSWRGPYRSGSVSLTVPPVAPSPPESVKSAAIAAPAPKEPEPEPTPVIAEDGTGEAAAEVETVQQEVAAEEDTTKDDSAEPAKTEEPHSLNQDQDADVPAPEEELAQTDPEPAADAEADAEADADAEEWGLGQNSTAKKTTKKNKKDKKKKKPSKQESTWPEEPAANLTPPSTPPPSNAAEVNNTPQQTAPAPEAEPEAKEEAAEAEPTAEPDEKDAEPVEEQPAEHQPAEHQPAEHQPAEHQLAEDQPTEERAVDQPAEEPSAKAEIGPASEDREQPSAYPIEYDAQTDRNSWSNYQMGEHNDKAQPSRPVIDMSFAKQPDSSPRTPGLSLWDDFAALQYNDEQQTSLPTVDVSSPTDLPYLTFHAKVYVFATRYLIPALAQLCLQKLHRNLLQLSTTVAENLDLGGLAAAMVLDLLQYTFTKTTRLEPINPTSATQLRENELRRLVVHYVACKVKDLARYHSPGDSEAATPMLRPVDSRVEREKDSAPKSLRALLDMMPELASDLVYRMM